jgi:hypothetical protein
MILVGALATADVVAAEEFTEAGLLATEGVMCFVEGAEGEVMTGGRLIF